MKNKMIIKIILLINLIMFINFLLNKINYINNYLFYHLNLLKKNKFTFKTNKNEIFFNLTSIIFSNNKIDRIIKVQYTIDFYYENDSFIVPSDLTLYNNLHVFCLMNNTKKNINVISLANILENKHYECVEFFKCEDKIFLGILINDTQNNYNTKFNLISNLKILFNYYKYQINNKFNCKLANQEYTNIIQNYNNIEYTKIFNNSLNFKLSYINNPNCFWSFQANINDNEWNFINLYNNYFCICGGLDCI